MWYAYFYILYQMESSFIGDSLVKFFLNCHVLQQGTNLLFWMCCRCQIYNCAVTVNRAKSTEDITVSFTSIPYKHYNQAAIHHTNPYCRSTSLTFYFYHKWKYHCADLKEHFHHVSLMGMAMRLKMDYSFLMNAKGMLQKNTYEKHCIVGVSTEVVL